MYRNLPSPPIQLSVVSKHLILSCSVASQDLEGPVTLADQTPISPPTLVAHSKENVEGLSRVEPSRVVNNPLGGQVVPRNAVDSSAQQQ